MLPPPSEKFEYTTVDPIGKGLNISSQRWALCQAWV